MTRPVLAINGGEPVRAAPFPAYRAIGKEEEDAVLQVLRSGLLSGFLGKWGPLFHGGPQVRALEEEWAIRFGVRHAVSVNSATSGLYAALGAAGIGAGDEVVVSPYTMSASAVGPLVYGATPVFADIDDESFCITGETIEAVLTPRTKAVVVVDLFGRPADMDPIRDLARRHGLVVIEDAAQAAGATYHGRAAGTLGDMGVFSLNYHKVIQSGEGGIVVTDNDDLADRLRLVRNHAETVVSDPGAPQHADLVGFNYRMTEIEAAISRVQLRKLDGLVAGRVRCTDVLRGRWSRVTGLRPGGPQPDCSHSYYVLPVLYDASTIGVPRSRFIEAVRAEGVVLNGGYVEPLYHQPIYAHRFPGDPRYRRGACPVAETLYAERLFLTALNHPDLSDADLDDVASAVEKVAAHANELLVTA